MNFSNFDEKTELVPILMMNFDEKQTDSVVPEY